MDQNTTHKSGFIAVIGRPNVGKSTLINTLIGEKIAIMSDKPQTTRNRILCILTQPDAQIVFLDTPGIHKPRHKLGEYMVKSAENTLKEVDAILFVVDATQELGPGELYILERLQATSKPVILVVNKIDLINKEESRGKEGNQPRRAAYGSQKIYPGGTSVLSGRYDHGSAGTPHCRRARP